MSQSPHYYKDGYVITNGATTGWKDVCYGRIYKHASTMPYQWNKLMKKATPVAIFVVSQWRGSRFGKNCWYGCDLKYKYSEN